MQPPIEGNHDQERVASSPAAKNYVLWTVQLLLALLFLFSGVMKFLMPAAKMQAGPVKFPMAFLYFIGVAEILGGLGLILPGMLRIRRALTPLAAAGLLIIMIGATGVTLMGGGTGFVFPLAIAVLVALIAYGRWGWMAG